MSALAVLMVGYEYFVGTVEQITAALSALSVLTSADHDWQTGFYILTPFKTKLQAESVDPSKVITSEQRERITNDAAAASGTLEPISEEEASVPITEAMEEETAGRC